jgi:hypothetical protein
MYTFYRVQDHDNHLGGICMQLLETCLLKIVLESHISYVQFCINDKILQLEVGYEKQEFKQQTVFKLCRIIKD